MIGVANGVPSGQVVLHLDALIKWLGHIWNGTSYRYVQVQFIHGDGSTTNLDVKNWIADANGFGFPVTRTAIGKDTTKILIKGHAQGTWYTIAEIGDGSSVILPGTEAPSFVFRINVSVAQ